LKEEEFRNGYPTKEWMLGSLLGGFGQHIPLDMSLTCKKQQTKACWKCCKTHQTCQKNFCFCIEIFTYKNQKYKFDILTYLREC
jgi:hypothetical protein